MSTSYETSSPMEQPEVGALSVLQFCDWAGISRAQFYIELRDHRIHPKKLGRRTLIPLGEATRWLDNLPDFGSK
jgi:hypothetical protein